MQSSPWLWAADGDCRAKILGSVLGDALHLGRPRAAGSPTTQSRLCSDLTTAPVASVHGGADRVGDLDLLERELLRLGEHIAVEGDEGGAVEVGPLAVAAPGVRLDCDIGKLLLARGLYRVVSNPQER